jgi:tripartite ATP-independent transporter DctP family solute receptor
MNQISRLIATAATVAATLASTSAVYAQVGYDKPIKIALTNSLEHPIAVGGTKFAESIEARSGGKMKARVYANATLGNDVQVISSLQGGTVEAAVVSIGLLSSMVKEYSLYTLPGVFHNVKEADQLMDGPFGTKLRDRLAEHRLVGLSYFEHGFKNVTNNKRPVNKVEDISGLKIRITQTPSLVDVFTALGANPVPMAYGELYGAMESGAIDGMETTLVTFENGKFFEVQKNIALTQHVYDPLILIFSRPIWDKMSPAQRQTISEAAVDASHAQRQATREREAKLIVDLKQKGVSITEFSPQEMTRMRAKLEPVSDKYRKLVGEENSKDFFAELANARATTSGK